MTDENKPRRKTGMYRCSHCNEVSSAREWNLKTKKICKCEPVDLETIDLNTDKTHYFYCPKCNQRCIIWKGDITKKYKSPESTMAWLKEDIAAKLNVDLNNPEMRTINAGKIGGTMVKEMLKFTKSKIKKK